LFGQILTKGTAYATIGRLPQLRIVFEVMLDARQVAAVKVGLRMLEEVLSFERSKTSCLVDYEKSSYW